MAEVVGAEDIYKLIEKYDPPFQKTIEVETIEELGIESTPRKRSWSYYKNERNAPMVNKEALELLDLMMKVDF